MVASAFQINQNDGVRLNGQFADPEMEAAYRRRYAPQDLIFARVIVCVAAAAVVALGGVDYYLVSAGTELARLWGARAAFFALSVVTLARLRSPSGFEWVFGGWYVLAVALHVYVGAVWPAGHSEMRITAAVAILMSYCVMPMTLRFQTAGALLHTAGALAVAGWLNPHGDAAKYIASVCWLALVNVLGVYLSHRLHTRQRLLFAAMLQQSELSASLGQALAEVRTLRGMIRVCAWCQKVDADGMWQQMEAYVRDHSHAEFTHGICPVCLAAATSEAVSV